MRIQILCAILLITMAHAQAPELHLRGDRFAPLTFDKMTPEQKSLTNNLLSGERKGMDGPFNVLLRSPEMGDLAQKLGAQIRFHSTLPDKLRELAIITTGRYWNAQYEWYAHKRLALQVGVSQATVDTIAAGKRPSSMSADEEIVYNFCAEMLNTKQVSDATFAAAKNRLGERGVVDLIALVGYYNLVSMLLNADRYPMPAGATAELKPIAQLGR
jgi:4-carboxymuconolactone decarboxylase